MKHRSILNIFLSLLGIGLMIYYSVCDTSCSYLRGDIFGIDLKYIGISYMLTIIILTIFRQVDIIRIMLAAGIGTEIFLVAFQFQKDVFCPFCLGFGLIVVIMNIVNYERPCIKKQWYQKLLYAAGDAKIPFTGENRIPLLAFVILGYLFVSFAFSGSASPVYAQENSAVPSYGNGSWELIVFTDYFCPPCQRAEVDLKPFINKLLSRGNVKITFVDFPGYPLTATYAKFFLYAVKANTGYDNSMMARDELFLLAKQKNKINTESSIGKSLKKSGVALQVFNHKPVFNEWKKMIELYKINQTPTCVLKYTNKYIKKFSGTDEIRDELLPELQAMVTKDKN